MATPDTFTASLTDLTNGPEVQRRVRQGTATFGAEVVRRVRGGATLAQLGSTVRRRIKVNPFQAGLSSEGLAVEPLPVGLQLPR